MNKLEIEEKSKYNIITIFNISDELQFEEFEKLEHNYESTKSWVFQVMWSLKGWYKI